MKYTDTFLKYLQFSKPLYFKSVKKCYDENNELFIEVAESLLEWSANFLGEAYLKTLADGYVYFLNDVNRSQIYYERNLKYKNKSYSQVYEEVYNDTLYMSLYHWGVLVTMFAWEHHLNIYEYFLNKFIRKLSDQGKFLDLGSGSGIWSLLAIKNKLNWKSTGVDISSYSVNIAQEMASVNGFSDRARFVNRDAVAHFEEDGKVDAVISCFLLEHLERPEDLLINAARNLKNEGYAFITAALTAAETDHIFEFRAESELVSLAEKCGFRVISFISEGPKSHHRNNYFLPRSMALIMRKKSNSIW